MRTQALTFSEHVTSQIKTLQVVRNPEYRKELDPSRLATERVGNEALGRRRDRSVSGQHTAGRQVDHW